MSQFEYFTSKQKELVELANLMLEGHIHLIEGVRKACSLCFEIGDSENNLFNSFRAIDSETDHYPLGKIRASCAKDYLQRVDAEMEEYLVNVKQDILDTCRDITRIYSSYK
jgi:hypothetical protein